MPARLVKLLLLLALSASVLAETPSLRIGWEDYRPYQFRDETGALGGLDVELVNAIADRAGYRLYWHEIAWKKHQWEVAAGSIDLAAGASRTPEREGFAYFSRPYRREPVSLVTVRDPGFETPDRDALLGLLRAGNTLGYVSSYSYAPWINDLIDAGTPGLKAAKSEGYLARSLLDGGLDGYLADAYTSAASLNAEQAGRGARTRLFSRTVQSSDIHLMFSRYSVSPEVVAAFDAAIEAMRADGSLARIVERYR